MIKLRILSVIPLLLIAYVCFGQRTGSAIIGKWNYVGIQPVDSDPWSQQLIDIHVWEK